MNTCKIERMMPSPQSSDPSQWVTPASVLPGWSVASSLISVLLHSTYSSCFLSLTEKWFCAPLQARGPLTACAKGETSNEHEVSRCQMRRARAVVRQQIKT